MLTSYFQNDNGCKSNMLVFLVEFILFRFFFLWFQTSECLDWHLNFMNMFFLNSEGQLQTYVVTGHVKMHIRYKKCWMQFSAFHKENSNPFTHNPTVFSSQLLGRGYSVKCLPLATFPLIKYLWCWCYKTIAKYFSFHYSMVKQIMYKWKNIQHHYYFSQEWSSKSLQELGIYYSERLHKIQGNGWEAADDFHLMDLIWRSVTVPIRSPNTHTHTHTTLFKALSLFFSSSYIFSISPQPYLSHSHWCSLSQLGCKADIINFLLFPKHCCCCQIFSFLVLGGSDGCHSELFPVQFFSLPAPLSWGCRFSEPSFFVSIYYCAGVNYISIGIFVAIGIMYLLICLTFYFALTHLQLFLWSCYYNSGGSIGSFL